MSVTISSSPLATAGRGRKKRLVAAALVVVGQLSGYGARSALGQAGPPPITSLKYTEDYSYLRDPASRSGAWWEPLKLVPIDSAGWAYLTIGDELRVRYERYWNNNFGSGKLPDEDYVRYRQVPYVSLNLGPALRVFGELMVAYGARNEVVKNAQLDQTGVDLLQGFVDVRVPLGSAGTITLRGGRQVLNYGSGRLINPGPNIRTSFDGGVVQWAWRDWRADAFFVLPVNPHFDWFDDRPDGNRRVWSLYATRAVPAIGPTSGLDLYYIGFENDRAAFNQGKGVEHRHTLGSRLFGASQPWVWDVEGDLQLGRFAGSDILAWSIATDGAYNLSDLPLNTFVGLRVAAMSGDGNPGDASLGTFNAMFALGGYFGENGVLGPGNLLLIRPVVGVGFASGWNFVASATFHWRASLGDGIYDLGGGLLRPDGGSRARFIGPQADAALAWQANRNLGLNASASVLWPGQFIKDTGSAETVKFVGAQVLFSF